MHGCVRVCVWVCVGVAGMHMRVWACAGMHGCTRVFAVCTCVGRSVCGVGGCGSVCVCTDVLLCVRL